jgi:hypothetical protein
VTLTVPSTVIANYTSRLLQAAPTVVENKLIITIGSEYFNGALRLNQCAAMLMMILALSFF